MTRRVRSGARDAGRIAVFYAILGPAFIALLGLVVDGGGKVRALQEAHNIASEAARTAGQAIYAPGAILGEETVLDPDAAVAAAEAYLSATPATDHSVELSEDLQQLTITVDVSYDPIILGFLDGGTWVVSGTVEATLVIG